MAAVIMWREGVNAKLKGQKITAGELFLDECRAAASDDMGRCVMISRDGSKIVMRMSERIESKLQKAFAPSTLSVTDDSHKHHGHAGWREGGETHFSVAVISSAFIGKGRVERHRMVNAALAEELQGGVHALAISAKAPGEA